LLIISNSSKKHYFELNKLEIEELNIMIHKCKELIEKDFKPDGYNIGMNCGSSAGLTVFQFHCHVIPGYLGDMKDPKGGVRHCIEGKGTINRSIIDYLYYEIGVKGEIISLIIYNFKKSALY
jgi:diadenosine tetraphosphate (Ap4A) HIT family hydrolase